jgi:hypothetical protein
MKRCAFVATVALAATSSWSCTESGCDRAGMLAVVNADIQRDNQDPDDYFAAEIVPEGDTLYLGMAPKESDFYRRHYVMDPRTCAIRELQIDQ